MNLNVYTSNIHPPHRTTWPLKADNHWDISLNLGHSVDDYFDNLHADFSARIPRQVQVQLLSAQVLEIESLPKVWSIRPQRWDTISPACLTCSRTLTCPYFRRLGGQAVRPRSFFQSKPKLRRRGFQASISERSWPVVRWFWWSWPMWRSRRSLIGRNWTGFLDFIHSIPKTFDNWIRQRIIQR